MEARMAQLERALRWWRSAAVVALALSGCALLLSLRNLAPGELRARELVLTGGEGGAQARLGFDERGEPRLLLDLRRNGGRVIVGALADDIGGMAVTSKDATIMISTDATGSPSVSVRAERRTAVLGIVRDNEPMLLMTRKDPGLQFLPNLSATPAGLRVRRPDGEVLSFPAGRDDSRQAPAPAEPQGGPRQDQSKN